MDYNFKKQVENLLLMNEMKERSTASNLLIYILRGQGNIRFLSVWTQTSVDLCESILPFCSVLRNGAF